MGLSEIFIRVLCIGSVLLYAASANLIANPETKVSAAIVEKLLELKNNTTSEYRAMTVEEQFLLTNVASRINAFESLFRLVGSLQQPLTIVIDRDHPLRVSIGATDLILGTQAVKAVNQLEHAILKAWIRQVGSSEVLNNPVRAEIYADLILAAYSGELRLQDPETKNFARFNDLNNWMNDLLGTAELCASAWRPAELISYCSGLKQNAYGVQSSYSLRKVIGSLIWQDIQSLSLLGKAAVLSQLARNVKSQTLSGVPLEGVSDSLKEASALERLRVSLETEAREIFPDLQSKLPSMKPVVGRLTGGRLALLGGFELQSRKSVQFKKMVIEACEVPSLKQLLAYTSEETEHILLVQNCERQPVQYDGFAEAGPARFALQNRSVKFAYLHRASLKLAEKMINNFDIKAALAFDPNSKAAKFLGLDQKIFREDLDAYKVNGPIGAIEWYRGENA